MLAPCSKFESECTGPDRTALGALSLSTVEHIKPMSLMFPTSAIARMKAERTLIDRSVNLYRGRKKTTACHSRSSDRTKSPVKVSSKWEYFRNQPETFGNFSSRLH
jgi:hypothetical protein